MLVWGLVALWAGSVPGEINGPGYEYIWNGNFEIGNLTTPAPRDASQNWSWDADVNPVIITNTPPEGSGQGGIGGNYAVECDTPANQYFIQNFYLLPNGEGFGFPTAQDTDCLLSFWYVGHLEYTVKNTFGGFDESGQYWWDASQDPSTPNPDAGEWTYGEYPGDGPIFDPAPYAYRTNDNVITIPAGTINVTVQFKASYPGAPQLRLDNVSFRELPIPIPPPPGTVLVSK